MKKVIIAIITSGIFFTIPCSSFAWGKQGHTLVAEIAFNFLDSSTKQNVRHYLESMTSEDAGNWMDQMRSDPEYDYMKSWHYINIEQGSYYVPSTDDNIVNHLIIAFNELKHKQTLCDNQVKTDILVLFHLIGDLHQPLHVGYGVDRGGNTVQVNFLSANTNLHHIWDTDIIDDQKISLTDCLQLYNSLSKEQIKHIKKIDFVSWMNDSRSLLDSVYNFSGHTLTENYAQKNKSVVEKQLLYAGIRLAMVLEELFKTGNSSVPDTKENLPAAQSITITMKEVANHIGEIVTVCDKVYGTKLIDRSQTTFINMGAKYPDSPLTVVIFSKDRSNFGQKPEDQFADKKVCVTGKIKQYQGKNEIVISGPADLKIQ